MVNLDPSRLWRFEAAAQVAGVSVQLLASAIANGDVPGVDVVTLGPRRVRFVRAEPFLAWLEGSRNSHTVSQPAEIDPIEALLLGKL